ncbi:leucine-rich repeat domain-containing protein, partial [Bacteroidales bacterium OttesenSCG-928-I21]|nr:leucine-rich repeat domain-containing protein [Bacteroidales bacterium OttesenSCG-928-I21]
FWEMQGDTLIISGQGEMPDFNGNTPAPWTNNSENIKYLLIEDDVTSIGASAFSSLKNNLQAIISLGNSMEDIPSFAFSGFVKLTSVTIPENVKSLGAGAFSNCCNVETIYYNAIDCTSGNNDTYNVFCRTSLTTVIFGDKVEKIPDGLFITAQKITEINFPASLTHIGKETFRLCNNLAQINTSQSVSYVGKDAFLDTKWYEQQPDGTIYIDKVLYAYKGIIPMNSTDITVKEGTVSITEGVFENNARITAVDLPASLKQLNDNAFCNCHNLSEIRVHWTEPLAITLDVFCSNPPAARLIVPVGTSSQYEQADVWKYFNIIEEGVTVSPSDNSVEITWQPVNNAISYALIIYGDSNNQNIICTLKFNSAGQLVSISFNAKAKTQETEPGFIIDVDNLSSNTTYYYTMTAYDNNDNVIEEKIGEFTTKGGNPNSVPSINNSELKLYVIDKTLVVENAQDNIAVYNIAGQMITTLIPTENITRISLPKTGVYIVKAGNKTFKLVN